MKKLNIGCGEFPLIGFINMDAYPGRGVELVCNALNLPMVDNSLDLIYMGHCIEHNTLPEARKILKECLRVLKEGGEIGIIVPEKDLTPKNMIIGEKFPKEPYREHHSFWTLDMLKKEVKKAGFNDIKEIDIDTYPYLVARPHWQVGVTAFKGNKEKVKEFPSENEICEHNKLSETWCPSEKKFIYDPTKRKHCPYCGGKLI